MKVFCYPVSRDSTYLPLIFAGIEDRYQRVYREDGSLLDAIRDIDAGEPVIVHIHWEEFVLRDCETEAQAAEAAAEFSRCIAAIGERSGTIVWTVHNEWPHVIPFHRQFLTLRAALAEHAGTILVHDVTSIGVLAAQVPIDRTRVRVLPHPSYLGIHEHESTLRASLGEPHDRRIQGFGWIRLQKGFSEMIGMLPADFLKSRNATVRISGAGVESSAVIALQAERTDVEWDVRHVPSPEVPRLLRSAACVVLPYERVLTSGVALLAMSVGAMIVAVDLPQLRELLPETSRRFLYARADEGALRARIDDVFALSVRQRASIVAANLSIARERRPTTIARRLRDIYVSALTSDRVRRPFARTLAGRLPRARPTIE